MAIRIPGRQQSELGYLRRTDPEFTSKSLLAFYTRDLSGEPPIESIERISSQKFLRKALVRLNRNVGLMIESRHPSADVAMARLSFEATLDNTWEASCLIADRLNKRSVKKAISELPAGSVLENLMERLYLMSGQ